MHCPIAIGVPARFQQKTRPRAGQRRFNETPAETLLNGACFKAVQRSPNPLALRRHGSCSTLRIGHGGPNVMQASFWYALVGGALIGLSASLLLLGSGRVAGISGVLGGVLLPKRGDRAWRALFLIGLLGAGALSLALFPEAIGSSPAGPGLLAVAGLQVGVGTRIGSGCTSGHGVCGVARLSQRSVVATAVFVAVGMLTTGVVRALGGL